LVIVLLLARFNGFQHVLTHSRVMSIGEDLAPEDEFYGKIGKADASRVNKHITRLEAHGVNTSTDELPSLNDHFLLLIGSVARIHVYDVKVVRVVDLEAES